MKQLLFCLVSVLLSQNVLAKIYLDYEVDPIPIVEINAVLPVGYGSKVIGEAAQGIVLEEILEDGTIKKNRRDFVEELSAFAAEYSFSLNSLYSYWELSFPFFKDKNYDALIRVLEENWKSPRFVESSLSLAKSKLEANLIQSLDNDMALAQASAARYQARKVLGIAPVYIEDVTSLNLANVESLYKTRYQTKELDIWVGMAGPSEALPLVRKLLQVVFSRYGEVIEDRYDRRLVPTLSVEPNIKNSKKTILILDKAKREQAVMSLSILSSKRLNENNEASFVFGNFLLTDNGFGAYFTNEIRQKRGLAYGVSGVNRYFYDLPQAGFHSNPQSSRADEALKLTSELVTAGFFSADYFSSLVAPEWKSQWQSFIFAKRIEESTPSGRLASRMGLVTGANGKKLSELGLGDIVSVDEVKRALADFSNDASTVLVVVGEVKFLKPLLEKYWKNYNIEVLPYERAIHRPIK